MYQNWDRFSYQELVIAFNFKEYKSYRSIIKLKAEQHTEYNSFDFPKINNRGGKRIAKRSEL